MKKLRKARLVSDNVIGHRVYKTSLGSTIRVRTICEMEYLIYSGGFYAYDASPWVSCNAQSYDRYIGH